LVLTAFKPLKAKSTQNVLEIHVQPRTKQALVRYKDQAVDII
jgi:hypothetical protein